MMLFPLLSSLLVYSAAVFAAPSDSIPRSRSCGTTQLSDAEKFATEYDFSLQQNAKYINIGKEMDSTETQPITIPLYWYVFMQQGPRKQT